jgi:6-phosphogluconolactonase (cycloisomerase 2 family)
MPAMRRGHLGAAAVGLLVLTLGACSGDGGTQPASYRYFAFVANGGDATISAFSIDVETGAMTPGPIKTLEDIEMLPESLALGPSSRFIYVVGGTHDIFAYAIDPVSGRLAHVAGSPFRISAVATAISVDPAAKFAYAVCLDSSNIAAFAIDASTGALTAVPGSPYPSAGGPSRMAFEPSGRFAYVVNYSAETVTIFSVDRTTGALAQVPRSTVSTGSEPQSIAVSPSGQFLYVANDGSDDISAFAIDDLTGRLTLVPGSPFAPPSRDMYFPEAIAIAPSGGFLYVVCGTGFIPRFSIDDGTGALTISGYSAAAGTSPLAIAFEPQGHFAYIVCFDPSGSITSYSVDPDTGGLVPEQTLPTGIYARDIVIARLSR